MSNAEEWLDAINQRGVNLTSWEEEFIESVTMQVAKGRPITDKQFAIIERIYTKRVP